MSYLLTFIAIALIVVVLVAVIPLLFDRDRSQAPATRSNLDGPQEEKIADQARPSIQEKPPET
jgi:hypothetical protein